MSFYLAKQTIENVLWDMIQASTQYPSNTITFGKTDKIRPEEPYITIRYVNLERAAKGQHLGYDEDGYEITGADYIMQFEIAAFREDPAQEINPFSTCWQISHALVQPQYNGMLSAAKVGFSDSTNVIDISVELDGASWEQRAAFNVTLLCALSEIATEVTESIETVETEQTLLDEDSEIISQETYITSIV